MVMVMGQFRNHLYWSAFNTAQLNITVCPPGVEGSRRRSLTQLSSDIEAWAKVVGRVVFLLVCVNAACACAKLSGDRHWVGREPPAHKTPKGKSSAKPFLAFLDVTLAAIHQTH